jgi:hypothetical protein
VLESRRFDGLAATGTTLQLVVEIFGETTRLEIVSGLGRLDDISNGGGDL